METFTAKLIELLKEELNVPVFSSLLEQNITISMQDAAPTVVLFRAQDGYVRFAAEKPNGKLTLMVN